jgi:hypothetical protein
VTSGSTVAKNIKGMLDAGMPGLFDENGAPYGTREEHFQEALRRVQNNELTNTDQSWVVDGSADERYMIDEVTYTPYTTRDGEGGTVTKYRETKTGNKVVDEAELRREAGKVFDALALELNAALTDQRDANTASASFESIKNGVQGGYADIVNNPTYTYEFNPLSPSPNAFGEMQNMLGQLKYLKENGIPFGIGTGTLKNEDQLLQRDGLGTKVLDLLIKDTQTWLNNPKRSNTAAIAPIFRLSYKSVFDIASKADKTHAGFEIDNMSEWLASKVKGPTSDVTKQFGALTTDDIALLKGAGEDDQGTGIFLVFDQKYDLNPKARKNDYFSSTEMDILGGDNSTYHDYVVPNDDGITNTGTFRITKNGTGDYDMIYEINRYNPKPTDPAEQANWTEYTTSTGSEKMDFSQGLMGIDQQTMKMQELLENIRTNNRALQKKDKAIHGK